MKNRFLYQVISNEGSMEIPATTAAIAKATYEQMTGKKAIAAVIICTAE